MKEYALAIAVGFLVLLVVVTWQPTLFIDESHDRLMCERTTSSAVGRWPRQTWAWECHAIRLGEGD